MYITNFIAEYSLRPEPQTEIIKYMGISSISQKIKNNTKSNEIKTPKTEVSKIKNHKKYYATRVLIDIEIETAQTNNKVVKKTNGKLNPSTPR